MGRRVPSRSTDGFDTGYSEGERHGAVMSALVLAGIVGLTWVSKRGYAKVKEIRVSKHEEELRTQEQASGFGAEGFESGSLDE